MHGGKYNMRKNPWFRKPISKISPHVRHYIKNLSRKRPKFSERDVNAFLDISTKKAALKASSSVVALSSYTGDQELTQCSGLIIEDDGNNGHIVLTSSKLIRCPTKDTNEDDEDVLVDHLADGLKVTIHLYDGRSYEGKVRAYDYHFNLAWIGFQSDSSLPTARLRQVNDYINVNPAEEESFHLRPPSTHFTLVPGDAIVAVGRYFAKPFDLMAAPGVFNIARCDDFECMELFLGTCLITSCGEGGPLVNLAGEVIGLNFYESCCTPFLPINIAQKCWEHFKRYWVIQGSSLDSAGLHANDVIVQCGGKTVHSFLEFLEMVWDMRVGDRLQLCVVRICENDPICVNMVVDEVAAENFYRWPRNGSR